MKKRIYAMLAVIMAIVMTAGCGGMDSDVSMGEKAPELSVQDARNELDVLLTKVNTITVENPSLDIYTDEISEASALADIDTFDMAVRGSGQINIEVAAATELSSETPDDWLVAVAKNFNRSGQKVGEKSVSVSVRTITSGEILTYLEAGAYQPHMAVFSNEAWGRMADASGIGIEKIEDRIAGNTAGILISKEADAKVKEKYGKTDFQTVIQAAQDGIIIFGYPNPYTSSTGLNGLTNMLSVFDPSDALSATASKALSEYQKTAPPVAYTTAVLRNQAKKGIIDAMLMEEQAYINTPEIYDYIYIPFGIRHDHPVYVFDWDTAEQKEAARLFTDYCMTAESQKLASDKGFNRHDEYRPENDGMTGQQYLTAQSLWKQNKNGGRPVVAVFVADISGSMAGDPLASLKKSVVATLPYIGSENYIGLVSYNSDVVVNLSILDKHGNVKPFDDRQRAYFSGEMKNLQATGGTATYNAVLTGLDMINRAQIVIPDAVPLIILLTDGDSNVGYTLSRITPIVEGMRVPVYCIAYNYSGGSLEKLSGINEASTVKAESDDIVNQLRNLFNTQL